jgi:hypothetical protein
MYLEYLPQKNAGIPGGRKETAFKKIMKKPHEKAL